MQGFTQMLVQLDKFILIPLIVYFKSKPPSGQTLLMPVHVLYSRRIGGDNVWQMNRLAKSLLIIITNLGWF